MHLDQRVIELVAAISAHLDGDTFVAEAVIAHREPHAPAGIIARKTLTFCADAEERSLEGRTSAEGDVHDLLEEGNIVGGKCVTAWQEGIRIHTLGHEHHLLPFLHGDTRSGTEVIVRISLQEDTLLQIDKDVIDDAGPFGALTIECLPVGTGSLEVEE